MDDLAAELGMSKKTLYAHFPSKEALLEAVMKDKFARVGATLEAIQRQQPEDFAARLHAMLEGMQRELGELKPPFVRDMRLKAPHIFQRLEQRRARLIETHFRSLFRTGQRSGDVRRDIRQAHDRNHPLGHPGDHEPAEAGGTGALAKRGLCWCDWDRAARCTPAAEGKAMKARPMPMRPALRSIVCLTSAVLLLAGCDQAPKDRYQGYVEGEFVYVSSPLAGILQNLAVQRGQQVAAGQLLFALDPTMEKAALDQANAALALSEATFKRQEELYRTGPSAAQDLDNARAVRDQDQQRLAQAKWNLEQMKQFAPQAGLVYDTLYRQGEWIAAGKPIVSLLPPANIKVRAFVPETRVGSIQPGDTARVMVDGVSEPFIGRVSYISPRAEYTPPVIYSQESREKFVFMVESVFDPATAAKLHPGQPVDVRFEGKK